ncbi:hypothetical protein AAVH_11468 [Aphelenchoides avenae]|nr:hypothetical protein AAVH_11468 [Aphelenchus avenae]
MRFARIGYVPKWMLDYPVGNLMVFFNRYCTYFQFVAHLIIAVNRYLVIAHPFESKVRTRISKATYAALFLAPLPGAATRLFGKVIAKPTDNPNIFVMSYDQEWITLAGSTAFAAYSVSTAVVSLGLEIRTFVIYHRLDMSTKRSKRDDYGLLIYALTQFVAQFLQAGYQIMQAVTSLAGLPELRKQTQVVFPYMNDLLCLSGSICLLLTR